MASIRRNLALSEFDIKETPDGKPNTFSIRFITKSGQSVFLPFAVASGLTADLKKNRLRGVMAIDSNFKRIGHPYPINIDLIMEWNGNKVIL